MEAESNIRGVIFDMDGVLIDSEILHYKSTIMYLNDELGLSYDEEENREFLGRSDFYMFEILKARYNLELSIQQMIERRRDIYLNLLAGNVQLIDGVADFVRFLEDSGYKLGLASSSLEKIINMVVLEGGIGACFKHIQSGENLANSKPDPEIFLVTAEKLGVRPDGCAVIEDTTVGIQAAKAAGMYAIGFAVPGAPEQDFGEADVVVDSFETLKHRRILPVIE